MRDSTDKLQISAVAAWRVREPISGRSYGIVRVTTQGGIKGYGECPAVTGDGIARARALLTGRQATAYEVIGRDLEAIPALAGAVNVALLDIVGRFSGAPVYQVLGGPTRAKARALAALEGATDSALAESLDRARERGFRAFAVPLPALRARNQGQAFVQAVRRRLELLRERGGTGADFVLDGAARLAPSDAAMLASALERFHVLWFDEPCALDNLAAVRKLAAENVTPLGFGRGIARAGQVQDLLREDAVDIVRPTLTRHGITAIRRMAAIAEAYYVAVAPFHDGGPVGTAAALHLAASLPNFFIQQIPLPAADTDRRLRAGLTPGWAETVTGGYAPLPSGPGLGITVDEAALGRHGEEVR